MCKCWSQWLLIAVIFAFSLMTLLAGCGIKGPLYLPEDNKTEQQKKKNVKKVITTKTEKALSEVQGK